MSVGRSSAGRVPAFAASAVGVCMSRRSALLLAVPYESIPMTALVGSFLPFDQAVIVMCTCFFASDSAEQVLVRPLAWTGPASTVHLQYLPYRRTQWDGDVEGKAVAVVVSPHLKFGIRCK